MRGHPEVMCIYRETFPYILSLSTEAASLGMHRMLFYGENYLWMQRYLKREV